MNKKTFKILFYPQQPVEQTTIYKITDFLNYEIVNNPKKQYDLAIHWEDTTFRSDCEILKNRNNKVLNLNCNDISKKKINLIFEDVFKYSTLIDPTTFSGKYVRKSNLNATHDGQIIECPIELSESDFIYQKLINNENSEWGIYDIRTPIFNQTIPFVLIKSKARTKRFEDKFIQSFIQETNIVFSSREVTNIIEFCKKLGLDYGELDILRDSTDNKIYIIDANNTPWWCSSLPATEFDRAMGKLADSFRKEFCSS